MNPLDWLLEGTFVVAGAPILVREVVGNAFGLGSAWFGLRRSVLAWPVGVVGNLLLLTVFLGGILDKPQAEDLWGQAGRQVFFVALSVYGWVRWRRSSRDGEASDGGAIRPGWASGRDRLLMLGLAVLGMVVLTPTLRALDSYGPLSDAWILTGSMLATYAMARGWSEFWLVWIAVDAVGVPLLVQAGYYPSAVMYGGYGLFCAVGFVTWLRVSRTTGGPSARPRPQEALR
ncbi:nicotinamide riboside transporter PnuC [Solicola sp. PLA-1-18]|uniref:nicotinamide riboside transporter PnuC n=1 Tax=Solicola sp. PLA-1-18 TaxID=3380532 RepID=UPI003B8123B0